VVLLILAACSGTGKSTLARRLLAAHPRLRLSVSHTTRAPRAGELHGREYFFVDRGAFEDQLAAGAFAEWAEYAGNLYGTARSTIAEAEASARDLLFDVDVVGAANLKAAYPAARSVFVLPPSWSELERRLRGRATESEAAIRRRLDTAKREVRAARDFDYLVENVEIDRAVADLEHIYLAAGLRAGSRLALVDALARGD